MTSAGVMVVSSHTPARADLAPKHIEGIFITETGDQQGVSGCDSTEEDQGNPEENFVENSINPSSHYQAAVRPGDHGISRVTWTM